MHSESPQVDFQWQQLKPMLVFCLVFIETLDSRNFILFISDKWWVSCEWCCLFLHFDSPQLWEFIECAVIKITTVTWWVQYCEIICRHVCTLDEEWCKHSALPLIHEYRESSAQDKGSIPISLPLQLYRLGAFQNRVITGFHDIGHHVLHITSILKIWCIIMLYVSIT